MEVSYLLRYELECGVWRGLALIGTTTTADTSVPRTCMIMHSGTTSVATDSLLAVEIMKLTLGIRGQSHHRYFNG